MFLRADRVTLEFPLPGSQEHASAYTGREPLGGQLLKRNNKSFVRALDDVTLDLRSGDRLALIGHNGSGKSTLLRALAGIYHPTSGTVSASGNVSGIFNINLGLRQEASGYRNLVLKGLMAGRTRAEIEAALPEIAEFTELGPYLDMPLHSYSQGMAMRLAFAATTAFTNDILVMDEWIGAGDARFREKIIARMNDFLHATTIIVVASHSTSLLRQIANRALWLEHGRIRAAGGIEVIDEYEAEVLGSGLDPALQRELRGGRGLWLSSARGAGAAHLLWNVDDAVDDLQLVLRGANDRRKVIRNRVNRCGAWPLAGWTRPGMQFEIASARDEVPAATCTIPDPAAP